VTGAHAWIRLRQAWRTLGRRDRKAIRIGALIVVPALLVTFGVRPYTRALEDARDRLAVERGLLERELSLLKEAQGYEQALDQAEDVLLREAPRLLGGGDPLAQSALLANYVTDRAIRQRVFLQGSETRPAQTTDGEVVRLAIEVRGVGDLEGILGLLDDLERGSKLIRVERFSLTQASRLNAADSRDEGVLGFAATVAGYALAPVEDAAEANTAHAEAGP